MAATTASKAAKAATETVKKFDLKAKELFAFNLLPPKSHDELRAEAARAARNFYAAVLPIGLGVFAIILFFINQVILGNNLNNWENAVQTLNTELRDPNTYLGSLKVRNGELRTKTELIAEPVSKNVNFNDVFTITNAAFRNNTSGAQPTSYGREDSGEFVVNGVSRSINGPALILKKFQEQQNVDRASLKLVRKDPLSNEYLFTITFVSKPIEEGL